VARTYRQPREPQVSPFEGCITWNDVIRSDTPWNWRVVLERMVIRVGECSVNDKKKPEETEEDDSEDVSTSEDEEHDEVEEAGDEPDDDEPLDD
jgi:hypothetical protein